MSLLSPNSLGMLQQPQLSAGLTNQFMPQVMQTPQLSALLAPQTQVPAGLSVLGDYSGTAGGTTGLLGGLGDWMKGNGIGANMPTFNAALGGLQGLSNLFMGYKSYGMMKDQHKLATEVTNTNLNNQIKATNGALEDRLRTRAQFNGDSDEAWKKQYEERKLTRG